jgi:hypothetical protein
MNPYAISSLIACFVIAGLGAYVFKSNPGGTANRLFALMMLLALYLSFISFAFRVPVYPEIALFLFRHHHIPLTFIASIFVHFSLVFPGRKRILEEERHIWLLPYISSLVFSAIFSYDVSYLIRGMHLEYWGAVLDYGPLYHLLAAYLSILTGYSLLNLLQAYLRSKSAVEKKKVKFVFLGIGVVVAFSMIIYIQGSLGVVILRLVPSDITLIPAFFVAYAILKYRLLAVEPVQEEIRPTKAKYELLQGHAYLVKNPPLAYEVFTDQVTHGFHGLCISRTHPDLVRREHGLDRTPVLWLSETHSESRISPTNRDQLIAQIEDFTSKSERSIILLDGLEYLITKNGYERVLSLLQKINELIAVKKSCLIVPVNASALKERELALLEREFGELP